MSIEINPQDDPEKGEKLVQATLGRITYMTDAKKSVQSADLVVEAIVENLKIKQDLFKSLDTVKKLEMKIYLFHFPR